MAIEPEHTLLADLKKEIASGKALVVVGTGVTMGATNRASTASWTGLIEDGVKHCVQFGFRD